MALQTGRMAREPNSVLPHLDTVTRVLHLYRQQALNAMGLPEHSLPQLQPELGLLGSELHVPTVLEDTAPSITGMRPLQCSTCAMLYRRVVLGSASQSAAGTGCCPVTAMRHPQRLWPLHRHCMLSVCRCSTYSQPV